MKLVMLLMFLLLPMGLKASDQQNHKNSAVKLFSGQVHEGLLDKDEFLRLRIIKSVPWYSEVCLFRLSMGDINSLLPEPGTNLEIEFCSGRTAVFQAKEKGLVTPVWVHPPQGLLHWLGNSIDRERQLVVNEEALNRFRLDEYRDMKWNYFKLEKLKSGVVIFYQQYPEMIPNDD